MQKTIIFILVATFFISCKKQQLNEDPIPFQPNQSPVITGQNVLVLVFDGTNIFPNLDWGFDSSMSFLSSGLSPEEQKIVVEAVQRELQKKVGADIVVSNDTLKRGTRKTKKIIITKSWEWYFARYGTRPGGVAFWGSWFWDEPTPAFVFSELLHKNSISAVVLHEFGHMLRLSHSTDFKDWMCGKSISYKGLFGEPTKTERDEVIFEKSIIRKGVSEDYIFQNTPYGRMARELIRME